MKAEPLLKLGTLLKRCKSANLAGQRPSRHNVWAQELGGELMQRGSDHTQWHPLPSTADLMNLSKELQQLAHELNKMLDSTAAFFAKHYLSEP